MGDYRRMGNMERHLGHSTTTTSSHDQLIDLWRNPRGMVLRIQALALVAIAFSFFLVAFGSCRRWSNRWIVQKGFLASQVLSLSLGTYSIGLMQSSPVKSEMYPIWAVSLLTLFGCIDPITYYIGLDYISPLLKVIFQLFLYCGYVMLMSVSTISSGVSNLAIIVLSAITFVKGFHRSLALVLPSIKRKHLEGYFCAEALALEGNYEKRLSVRLPVKDGSKREGPSTSNMCMDCIHISRRHELCKLPLKEFTDNRLTIEEVCLGYSLSHVLERRFIGLTTAREMKRKISDEYLMKFHFDIDYERILMAIEIELAFLYEVFFTSNEFLYYYEARTCSLLALASFIGICLVAVAAAIPGTMASRHRTRPGAGNTVVVATTTADLIVTLVILVLLAVLQLLQLIRCWASNWGRVAVACEYAVMTQRGIRPSWWLGLKAKVATRMNWFDKYLWQDKLGQYSLVEESWRSQDKCCSNGRRWLRQIVQSCCDRLAGMVALKYIGQVLRELLVVKGGAGVRLDDDVKTCIIEALGGIKHRLIGDAWWSLFDDYGLGGDLPFSNYIIGLQNTSSVMPEAYTFAHRVMIWHVATSYCELAEQEAASAGGGEDGERNYRRVAIALSRYCAYLVVSAPDLLPGPSAETKRAFDEAVWWTRNRRRPLAEMYMKQISVDYHGAKQSRDTLSLGVHWGQRLLDETRRCCSDPWKMLAELWVRTLLYAAPSGDRQAHMQHLSRGGEFITHLWALLYHIGIDGWEMEPVAERERRLKRRRRDQEHNLQQPEGDLEPEDGGVQVQEEDDDDIIELPQRRRLHRDPHQLQKEEDGGGVLRLQRRRLHRDPQQLQEEEDGSVLRQLLLLLHRYPGGGGAHAAGGEGEEEIKEREEEAVDRKADVTAGSSNIREQSED